MANSLFIVTIFNYNQILFWIKKMIHYNFMKKIEKKFARKKFEHYGFYLVINFLSQITNPIMVQIKFKLLWANPLDPVTCIGSVHIESNSSFCYLGFSLCAQ